MRLIRLVFFTIYTVGAATLIAFSVLEWFPGLLHRLPLQGIRYYAMLSAYRSDDTLVFVPRQGARILETDFEPDPSLPSAGSEPSFRRYVASYDADGLRTNSSGPPFEVVLLGDSFVEIGTDDRDTLSERLKAVSGRSTQNLGRGYYGPAQYVELYRRHGATAAARYVVLCFFDGNDARDTRHYLRWRRGGDYHHYVLSRKSFFQRYAIAFYDTFRWLRASALTWKETGLVMSPDAGKGPAPAELPLHRDEGVIRLGNREVRMRFSYWNEPVPPDGLLQREEWQALRGILSEFQALARARGAAPIVLFIPNKIAVYGRLATDRGGGLFRERIAKQVAFETNSSEALGKLSGDLDIRFVNLLPRFQHLARQGEILYYLLDTHWSAAGRQAAAEFLAASLKRSEEAAVNK